MQSMRKALKCLNDDPVLKPKGNISIKNITKELPLETLHEISIQANTALKQHNTEQPPKVSHNRESIEAIIKNETVTDQITGDITAIANELATSETKYEELLQSSSSVHMPRTPRPTKKALKPKKQETQGTDALMSLKTSLESIQSPIQFQKHPSGYEAWKTEWAEWQGLYGSLPKESIIKLTKARDKLANAILSLEKETVELERLDAQEKELQADIDAIKAIPYNDGCWACVQHHAPSQERLKNKNIQFKENIKNKNLKNKNIKKFEKVITSSPGLPQLEKALQLRIDYEDRVAGMNDAKKVWDAAVLEWEAEAKRIAQVAQLTTQIATIEWAQYDKWVEAVAKAKAQRDHLRKCMSVMEAKRDLHELDGWEKWKSKEGELIKAVNNATTALWTVWYEEKLRLENKIQVIHNSLKELHTYQEQFEEWHKTLAYLDSQEETATIWAVWLEKSEALRATIDKLEWIDHWKATTASIEKNQELLKSLNEAEKLQKSLMYKDFVDVKAKLETFITEKDTLTAELVGLQQELTSANGIDSIGRGYKTVLDELKESHNKLKILRDLFIGTKNGDGFKARLYRDRVMPLIEREINGFLAELEDFKFIVKMIDDKVIYMILDRGNEVVLSHASGYQKFVIGLAMRAALCKIGAAGQALKHIVIDEGFGCCDASNIQRANEIVRELMERGGYKSIILMSHIDAIREVSQRTINIIRDEGKFSYIRHGIPRPKKKRNGKSKKLVTT